MGAWKCGKVTVMKTVNTLEKITFIILITFVPGQIALEVIMVSAQSLFGLGSCVLISECILTFI